MPEVMTAKRFTVEEWLAEGERRFGTDRMNWRFVCPSCGHVQAVEGFVRFKSEGAAASSAYFNCIGRYGGPAREAFGEKDGGPCNYTSGGLFKISPVEVVADGTIVRVFDFADPVVTSPT